MRWPYGCDRDAHTHTPHQFEPKSGVRFKCLPPAERSPEQWNCGSCGTPLPKMFLVLFQFKKHIFHTSRLCCMHARTKAIQNRVLHPSFFGGCHGMVTGQRQLITAVVPPSTNTFSHFYNTKPVLFGAVGTHPVTPPNVPHSCCVPTASSSSAAAAAAGAAWPVCLCAAVHFPPPLPPSPCWRQASPPHLLR